VTEPPTDRSDSQPVLSSQVRFTGRVWDIVTDIVELPGGERVVRDILLHPSAVAVLALDDRDRVLAVNQYRHAAKARLWELPAGLLDVTGERPLDAARRELWEETHHHAADWAVLVDYLSSPGFADEALRVYLARGVVPADGAAHPRHGEERDMSVAWFPLDELVDGILAGQLHNPTMTVGVLAAAAARAGGWRALRAADADWQLGPRSFARPGDQARASTSATGGAAI
jgi:8-oxo-dGDP phosphatase